MPISWESTSEGRCRVKAGLGVSWSKPPRGGRGSGTSLSKKVSGPIEFEQMSEVELRQFIIGEAQALNIPQKLHAYTRSPTGAHPVSIIRDQITTAPLGARRLPPSTTQRWRKLRSPRLCPNATARRSSVRAAQPSSAGLGLRIFIDARHTSYPAIAAENAARPSGSCTALGVW